MKGKKLGDYSGVLGFGMALNPFLVGTTQIETCVNLMAYKQLMVKYFFKPQYLFFLAL